MKKVKMIVGAVSLVLALALMTVAHAAPKAPANAATAATAATPATTATPATAEPVPVPEEHPEIHAALESLRNARVHLRDAKHDFGGHRTEALRAVDNAIRQLEICMRYDN